MKMNTSSKEKTREMLLDALNLNVNEELRATNKARQHMRQVV